MIDIDINRPRGQVFQFRPLPEIRSLSVVDALTRAAQTALNAPPLTRQDRHCAAMKASADLMDALARDTQDMIDRCRELTITHEALIERLTLQLGVEKAVAKMFHEDAEHPHG
jgi:hypothetical protein